MNDSEEGICCDSTCERWFHLRCSGLSQLEYDELGLDVNAKWACRKCSGTDKHLQLLPPRRTPHAFLLCSKTLLSNPKCWVLCTNPCMLSSLIYMVCILLPTTLSLDLRLVCLQASSYMYSVLLALSDILQSTFTPSLAVSAFL